MKRTKSTYLALVAVLLSPMAANADLIGAEITASETRGSLAVPNIIFSESITVPADGSIAWDRRLFDVAFLDGETIRILFAQVGNPDFGLILSNLNWGATDGFIESIDTTAVLFSTTASIETSFTSNSVSVYFGDGSSTDSLDSRGFLDISLNVRHAEVPEPETTFSIVIIPDTQMYVEQHPEVFEAQVDWIVANEAAENIIYVAHLGDLKDDLSCDTKTVNVGTGGGRSEWQIVDDTLGDLDAAGIAYGVVPGNHDFDQVNGGCPNFSTQRPLGTYNSLVGPLRFAGLPHYGDPSVPTDGNRVINSNEDNFTLFESNGVKLIAINLAYRQGANAVNNDPEVVWADALLKAYPDRLGIITSHYFMDENPGNSLGPYGQEIYDGLSNNPNMFMMLSAHEFGEAWLVETTGRGGMEPVQILLSDYQRDVFPAVDGDINTPPNDPNPAGIDFTNIDQTSFGDAGFMRIMRFDTITGMVNIETFIPPVIPIKNRPGTLVSTYFPGSGAGMGESTASNLSFSYLGYVP